MWCVANTKPAFVQLLRSFNCFSVGIIPTTWTEVIDCVPQIALTDNAVILAESENLATGDESTQVSDHNVSVDGNFSNERAGIAVEIHASSNTTLVKMVADTEPTAGDVVENQVNASAEEENQATTSAEENGITVNDVEVQMEAVNEMNLVEDQDATDSGTLQRNRSIMQSSDKEETVVLQVPSPQVEILKARKKDEILPPVFNIRDLKMVKMKREKLLISR